jgi:dolichol-phosphate mannosyltransferase
MEPSLIPKFIGPISQHQTDYTKGNRFYYIPDLRNMLLIRLFGNVVLSFMTKLSSGYSNIFDPANVYTAIQASLISHLSPEKISHDYFFESDMFFRLNFLQAKVVDIPMSAKYSSESSNLMVRKIIPIFLYKNYRADHTIQIKPLECSSRHFLEQWIQNTGLGNLYVDQYLTMTH